MASLHQEKSGGWRVQFVSGAGRRLSVRLGKMPKRQAEGLQLHIEALASAKTSGQPVDRPTALWLADISDDLHGKLAGVGLCEARGNTKLGEFIDKFIAEHGRGVKAGTVMMLDQGRASLLQFFGRDKLVSSITPADAEEFRASLRRTRAQKGAKEKPLAEATRRKRCGMAKQFFKHAVDVGIIQRNPFARLVSTVRGNPKLQFFITREVAAKVLDACPDLEWRLLFSLSRFGGLRMLSEAIALRWEDIFWKEDRFRVRSSKTEHQPGGGERWVPLWPELRGLLLEAFTNAEPGAVSVITKYRDSRSNVRTQLERIIRKAGLKPWPKLWHNMRSSRQTELIGAGEPMDAVCRWMGNSRAVAMEHYLQPRDGDFAAAVKRAELAVQQAVQNPVQHLHGPSRRETQSEQTANLKMREMQVNSDMCGLVQSFPTSPHGFEP